MRTWQLAYVAGLKTQQAVRVAFLNILVEVLPAGLKFAYVKKLRTWLARSPTLSRAAG